MSDSVASPHRIAYNSGNARNPVGVLASYLDFLYHSRGSVSWLPGRSFGRLLCYPPGDKSTEHRKNSAAVLGGGRGISHRPVRTLGRSGAALSTPGGGFKRNIQTP